MPAETSPVKTILMGFVAVGAIILSIVVAVKTFSDGGNDAVGKPPTEPIAGQWTRKIDAEPVAPPPGAPAEYMIAKDIESFDAGAGGVTSLPINLANGKSINGKVLTSQPGYMMVEVKLANGKNAQLTVSQMGEGGPVVITDGISTMTFEHNK